MVESIKWKYLIFGVLFLGAAIYLVGIFGIGSENERPESTTPKSEIVERIVSLCKHPIPFIILGLDASDHRLVGINPATKRTMETKVLKNYFPEFKLISDKICNNSFAPNIEEIVRLNPDVVFTWSSLTSTTEKLKNFNLNVVDILYDGSELNDRVMINDLAKAIGQTAKADRLIVQRDIIKNEIEAISSNIPPAEKLKVIFFYNYDHFNVGGELCYENFCMQLVGGINMGQGLGLGRNVNIEQILEWNPDVILYGGWQDKVYPEEILQNPLFSDVTAVKKERVYKMPHWESTISPLIWLWMSEVFYPERYSFDLRTEIKTAYKNVYNISISENEVDQVLFMEENKNSHGYTQFESTYK